MRKLRKAAVVATVIGSVSMIGAGAASAHGGDETPASVSIDCTQETGDTTSTTQSGIDVVSDSLNGGDADISTNQQLCGLDNEEATNSPATDNGTTGATGGEGGVGNIDFTDG